MIIGLGISAILLFLVFRSIDIQKVWESLVQANFWWIPVAIGIYFLGIWVRTTRWVLLMKPIKQCTTSRFFPIYVISYMANNILPLRIGDIYRAYIVGKKEKVSKGASLVTIGVERIFDGLTMLALLFGAVLFYPVTDPKVKMAIQIGAIVFLSAILACYFIILRKNWAVWIFKQTLRMIPEPKHARCREIFDNFYIGLDSLRGMRDILAVMGLSLSTWLIEAASYMVVLWSFGFWGPLHVAISTMAMVNLMIIVPSSPGYFGPFEMACVVILGKTGYGGLTQFTNDIAVAYAIVLHVVVQWIPSTLLGLIYMWKEHISFNEIQIENEPDHMIPGVDVNKCTE